MTAWREVAHTRDDRELPDEGVEYITAADEERRRINRERQRRFRERVKAGAKIAVYKPRQPGATKPYARRTKVDRGCNCTLIEVERERDTAEARMMRAMGIRCMIDTETGEVLEIPDPLSERWRNARREMAETQDDVLREVQDLSATVEQAARMVMAGTMDRCRLEEVERRLAQAYSAVAAMLVDSRQEYDPMAEAERSDDIFSWP